MIFRWVCVGCGWLRSRPFEFGGKRRHPMPAALVLNRWLRCGRCGRGEDDEITEIRKTKVWDRQLLRWVAP